MSNINERKLDTLVDYLNNIPTNEIIEMVKSERFDWQGWDNGDNSTKYQARKCEQMILLMIITSRVLNIEINDDLLAEKSICYEDAERLFYDYIRTWSSRRCGNSGNDGIRFDLIPNMFKAVGAYLPKRENMQIKQTL